ncbi:MAG: glycosyltransferase family 39 protein [Candidatus Kapabacteria bacterium]|nr:glycosyltransferase family 39 protein [Candidatus Kapabacteria bacterium]
MSIISYALLLPTLTFPLFGDQAIYARGAQVILNGGTLYIDYLDLKPPLIYYLFTPIVWLFGYSDLALRAGDLIVQAATVTIFIYCIRRLTRDDRIAYIGAVMFSIGYVSIGFLHTLCCETFMSPLVILLIYHHLKRDVHNPSAFVIGVLTGIICALKYTAGIVLPFSFIAVWFMSTSTKLQRFILMIWIVIGFILTMSVCHIQILMNTNMLDGYRLMLQFVVEYNKLISVNGSFIRDGLKMTSSYFGDMYSLLFSAFAIAGIWFGLSREQSALRYRPLVLLVVLYAAGLYLSVVLERRFGNHHFMRMYILMILLSAIGFVKLSSVFPISFSKHGVVTQALIVVMAVFTPLPRYAKYIPPLFGSLTDSKFIRKYYTRYDQNQLRFLERDSITGFITANRTASKRTLIVGMAACQMNLTLDEPAWSVFSHAQFFFAEKVPDVWKNRFYKELRQTEYTVVFMDDEMPMLNGHSRTSWESLQRDSVAYPYFKENFSVVYRTENILVFKRNPPRSIPVSSPQ